MKLAELAGLFDMSMRREALQQFFYLDYYPDNILRMST